MAGKNKVVLTFAGDAKQLEGTLRKAEAKTASFGAKVSNIGKSLSVLASGGAAVNAIGGTIGALTALSGAALLVPGAALAGAAAMQTFKLATAGFGDAMSAGLSGDVEALAEATKGMHPEMARAAQTVAAMKPRVDGLKRAVQGGFWDQFSGGIKSAGDTYLPLLTTQLPKLSTELGNMAKQSVNASTTPFFTGAVSSILGNTTEMFRGMRSVGADVLTGLVGIGQIGATYLPMLGQNIGGVTAKFKAWATSFEGRNQIQAWINGGILAFQQLGMIAGNIGSVLGSVFTGLGGSVDNPLAKVVQFTAKLAELAASQGAQQALQALGVAMQAAGALGGAVLLSALQTLVPLIIALAPLVTSIATTMSAWAPVLGPIVVGAYALAQGLTLVRTVMTAYNAAALLFSSTTVTTAATTVAGWVTMAASATMNAARVVAGWVLMGVQSMIQAARMAAAWLIAMGPIGWAIAAIVGLAAIVIANWDRVKSFTISAWKAFSAAISSGIDTAMGFVRRIPSMILGALSSLGSLLVNSGRSLIEGLWSGIQGAIGWVKGKISGALSAIRNLFPFSPAKEGPFSGKGYTTHSGRALMTDFGKGMASVDLGGITRSAIHDDFLRDLAAARAAGKTIFEDLSWRGMSERWRDDNLRMGAKPAPRVGTDYQDFLRDMGAARAAGKTIFEDLSWRGMSERWRDDDLRMGSRGGGGGGMVLAVSSGADSAVATMINALIRKGELQLVRA